MIPLNGCGTCGHFWESFDIDQEDPRCPECSSGGPPPVETRRSAEIAIEIGRIVDNAIITARHTAEGLDREIQNRINSKLADRIRKEQHGLRH